MAAYTKKLQFSQDTIKKICARDKNCIFCKMGYHMELTKGKQTIYDIMHIVNKSALGLGIEQNGVLGCRAHHSEFDNGNKGLHEEMQQIAEEYLKNIYPGWTREKVTYSKWTKGAYNSE